MIYKALFYVLHRYVFGAALGFLLRVLRVIGAGCFWLRVLGFCFGFGNYGGACGNFLLYGKLSFYFWIRLFLKGVHGAGTYCLLVQGVLCTLYLVNCI